MKQVGLNRTIEQLLKVDPTFDQLTSIKNRLKRNPAKAMDYWKELLEFVNSDAVKVHPKLNEIKSILVPKKKPQTKQLYTFEPVTKQDSVIGIIPENIADHIRRHDRKAVKLAKTQVEASMTHDTEKQAKIMREETLMEISMRKIWLDLKDHFKIWDRPCTFSIKKHAEMDMLVLIEQCSNQQQQQQQPGMGMMRIDPKNFFRMLGMEPPPTPEE